MDWQSYVDNNLIGTGSVSHAAIYDLNRGGVLATSPDFSIGADELDRAIADFNNPNAVYAHGLKINGTKYLDVDVSDRYLCGKHGPNGCCVVKTSQTVLVAIFEAPIQISECFTVTQALATYLISRGY